jgi:HEAT repeat protein
MSWLSKLLWSGEQRPPTSWAEWMTEARSHSGYVREAAVQALALSGHGDALPVLLERANDWVPEVRRAAYAAVEGFLDEEHIGAWGRALVRSRRCVAWPARTTRDCCSGSRTSCPRPLTCRR